MITPKIQNIYDELTCTEQRLADYILLNPEKIVHMTTKELAQECDTAPSAVIRMCKSIDLQGFAELKISLANELGKNRHTVKKRKSADSTVASFTKSFGSSMITLENTLEMIDFKVANKIVKKIFSSDRTFIFGIGTSSVVAIDMAYRLSQIGVQAYAYTDILYMNMMAMNLREGDVAVCISHTGKTKTVIDALCHAKACKAATVVITSYSKSILASKSDYVISAYADDEHYPVEAVSARIAHMCIVDALVMSVSALKKDNLAEYIKKRNVVLGEIKYK